MLSNNKIVLIAIIIFILIMCIGTYLYINKNDISVDGIVEKFNPSTESNRSRSGDFILRGNKSGNRRSLDTYNKDESIDPEENYTGEENTYYPKVEGAREAHFRRYVGINNLVKLDDQSDNPGRMIENGLIYMHDDNGAKTMIVPSLMERIRFPKKNNKIAFGQNTVAYYDPEDSPDMLQREILVPSDVCYKNSRSFSNSVLGKLETQNAMM